MSFMQTLIEIPEPELLFGFGQTMAHPKDGLSLYGPLLGPLSGGRMKSGVVATPKAITYYRDFVDRISRPIAPARTDNPNHSLFPGFQAIFGVDWPSDPVSFISIDASKLADAIRISDRHQAIHTSVSLYADAIADHLRNDADTPVDMWMAVVPEEVYKYCRPKSKVSRSEAITPAVLMNRRAARRLLDREPSLFEEDNRAAELYLYELDFHNQLKARLLVHKQAVQVVRETTLAPEEFLNSIGAPARRLQDPATLAWNFGTTCIF